MKELANKAAPVIKGVHLVPVGMANAYLVDGHDGLTLIDAGYPAKEAAVFAAIRAPGRPQHRLKHLILTHAHPDHMGSAAAIVHQTDARTYMHPLDIPIAETGGPFRPMTVAPGLLRRVLSKILYHPNERLQPVAIDQPLTRRGNAPRRRRNRGDLCFWALRGTGRPSVASGTNAVRGRRVPATRRRVSAISGARNQLRNMKIGSCGWTTRRSELLSPYPPTRTCEK